MAIILFRTLIIFLSLVAAMRLMGKRQLGELELSELIVTVLISDIAAHPLQDIGIPLLNGLLPIVVLLCCELLISGAIVKSIKLRAFLCGKPSVLIENGVIVQREMKSNRFTIDELSEELRNQSVTDISKIKYAILETSGKLNIILFPAEKPVTAALLGLGPEDNGYPVMLINDGRVLDDNLTLCQKDRPWLNAELMERNVTDTNDVYIMTLDAAGNIYFSQKERQK